MFLCKYPIKVVFLDDDIEFLESLKLYYSNKYPAFEYYHMESVFLERVYNYEPDPFINYYLTNLDEDKLGQRAFAFNIQDICNEMQRKNKEEQIAIVVVDQNLTNTTGLKILQEIQKPNLAKFLLTAKTDTNTAVEAFNKRIINSFISKSSPNMMEELDNQIHIYMEEYFKNFSSYLINLIKLDKDRQSALNEVEYLNLFNSILEKLKVREYYLLDTTGSYVFIDNQNNQHFLLVVDLNSISSQIDILREHNISEEIILKVNNAEKLLYLPKDIPYNKIENYIFEANTFSNKKFGYCFLNYNPFYN